MAGSDMGSDDEWVPGAGPDEQGADGAATRASGSVDHQDQEVRTAGAARAREDREGDVDSDDNESDDDDADSDEEEDEEDEHDHDANPPDLSLVRQTSQFERLSADSWVTVVSEYEESGAAKGAGSSAANGDPSAPNHVENGWVINAVEEEPRRNEANEASVRQRRIEGLAGRSVLDCVVELLRGTRAQKKKVFGRYGERWIWLGEDLLSLNFKSKRKDENGRVNLAKVRKLKSTERELVVESQDGRRITMIMSSKEEAMMWLTGLSCLVPKRAKVAQTDQVLVKERVNYDPLRDAWRGKLVATRKRVNEYILLGGIGKGSFGKVKLSLSTDDKRFYAVKIITRAKKGPAHSLMGSREEHAVLKKLDHRNICKHRDILYDAETDRLIIVVEYMARGVVMDSSKLEGVKPLSEDGVREIMRDVVCGLEYLHFQHIVHRDLKPDNLLRAGDGTVRISDFGEVRMYDVVSDQRGKPAAPGTPAFIAPELCMSDKGPKAPPQSYAADVWSLGATLFYMVYGRAPFLAKSVFEIYDAICTHKLTFPESPKVSKKLKDLLKRMLTKDPQKRATLADVARHPWFVDRVVQPKAVSRIRLTQQDIDTAIRPGRWVTPPQDALTGEV